MSYMHIDNLYKDQRILMFRECWALEKIHGTSAHVGWTARDDGVNLRFFSGGEKHDSFVALFDRGRLLQASLNVGHPDVTVYGEAYGGKCQGMKATYGSDLRFVAFEVRVGETWLSVPNAADVAGKLGLEFVHHRRIPADLAAIDAERDADSEQAIRNGVGPGKMREGVVLRPLVEVRFGDGSRCIAKHKRAEFAERRTIPEVDPSKRELMERADDIAVEWVTPMRLTHVVDALGGNLGIEDTGRVIAAMVEDVCREASGEIVESKAVRRAIGAAAAKLWKERCRTIAVAP